MTYRIALFIVLILLFTACSPMENRGTEILPSNPAQGSTNVSPDNITATVTDLETSSTTGSATCADEQVREVAEMVASSYSSTSTDEVLSWFCDGAEFEDIALALETENATGTPAEDMLQMRADGLTWEEIWQVTGLYED
jgi:ActR/RegA family two-component response regulator